MTERFSVVTDVEVCPGEDVTCQHSQRDVHDCTRQIEGWETVVLLLVVELLRFASVLFCLCLVFQ